MAFAGRGEAIFLDEPTTGLDIGARRAFWQTAQAYLSGGGSLFLTTHYLEEAEMLATRVVMIDHGRIVGEGSVDEIKAQVSL